MVEPIDMEYYDVITITSKQDIPKPKMPFVLMGSSSNIYDHESSQTCAGTITRSCAKLALKGLAPSSSAKIEQHKDKALAGPSGKGEKPTTNAMTTSYSILD